MSFKIGLETQNLACQSCLTSRMQSGFGKCYVFKDKYYFYGLLNTRLQSEEGNSGNIAIGPEISSLVSMTKLWKSLLSFEQRFYLDGNKSKHPIYSWENRFGNDKSWDFRITFKQHIDQQIKIAYSHYW